MQGLTFLFAVGIIAVLGFDLWLKTPKGKKWFDSLDN